jgi:predicted DNA-binding protein YlxM (UPF0122 family)
MVPEGEMDALRERVEECFASLDERERKVVRLYYEEGLSYREIGERIGVSRQRVSEIVKRLLQRLRKRPARDSIIGGLPFVQEYDKRIGELEDMVRELFHEIERLKGRLRACGERLKPEGTDISLKDMELPMRAYNVLLRHGYETVGDFIGRSAIEIRGYKGMGEGSFRELCGRLMEYNIALE